MRKLLATLLLVPALAHAEFETGNMLYQKMTSTNRMDQMYGIAYVAGVYDATHTLFHCPPDTNITLGQVHDMVKNHLELNPSIRHKFADGIIRELLKKTWPCRNNRGQI